MRNIWAWIAAIAVGAFIVALIFFGGSSQQAYRTARGAINQRVELSQDRIDAVAQMATVAVDLALVRAGELPAQTERADAIKQGIEEISESLKDVAEARGDLALAKLDASIELFDKTMDTVEEASTLATDPVVKAKLDCLYESLEVTQEQVRQAVLDTP